MNKTAIKNFAVWARKKLIADICYRAQLLGITEEGIKDPLPQSTGSVQFFDIGTAQPYAIGGAAISQRAHLADAIRQKAQESDYKTAYQSIVEEVAYTWFNRLIAVRFMEVNDYLPSHLRVLSSDSGKLEPDLVTRPFDADFAFFERERAEVARMQQNNAVDELFCLLFIKQCNALYELLPALFERTRDYTELLLSLSVVDREGVVYHLVHDIPEEDFDISRGGQVEIIGWLYQYYNAELKDETFALLKKNVKITKERIPSATQLFTPDWIVRYMVENSLGRIWEEGHPNSVIKANWKYYLEEAEQPAEVEQKLEVLRAECRALKLQDIKVIDPCMGSGHILVYAFEVLMQIYESQGFSRRDAAQSIVENNLYGLDIDNRAAQLAYFAVLMKARQYDRRFLSLGIYPQVYCPMADAELTEYGSMTQVQALEAKPVLPVDATLFEQDYDVKLNDWNVRRLLAQTYKVVCTNPPYLNKYNAKLKEFVNGNYKDYSGDLFSVFIYRNLLFCGPGGYCGYMAPNVWMFIKSYEKLRLYLLDNKLIVSLVQMAKGAFFREATVDICTFILQNVSSEKEGLYFRLEDFKGDMDVQRQKVLEAIQNPNCGYFYEAQQTNFAKIPGCPIAYWIKGAFAESYIKYPLVGEVSNVKKGMFTGANDLFFRFWYEPFFNAILFNAKNKDEIGIGQYVPMNSGGDFRRWYGNNWKVIKFDKTHYDMITANQGHRNPQYYFTKSAVWTKITSGKFSLRLSRIGFINNDASMAIYEKGVPLEVLTGLLNSHVAQYYLSLVNESLNYTTGNVASIPYINVNSSYIIEVINDCVNKSKSDWDSYETSWDFKKHPLI